jgi:hypothetical protein
MCRGSIGDSFSTAPQVSLSSLGLKLKLVELDKSDEKHGKRIQICLPRNSNNRVLVRLATSSPV